MFAEDLQGDIYNSDLSVLFLFSHSAAPTEKHPLTPAAQARSLWDCDTGLAMLRKQSGLKEVIFVGKYTTENSCWDYIYMVNM